MEGVHNYPIEVGSYNNRVVYSPHVYGPSTDFSFVLVPTQMLSRHLRSAVLLRKQFPIKHAQHLEFAFWLC